jgi:hypothetical protein
MIAVTVGDKSRIRLPGAEKGQVYQVEKLGAGEFRLLLLEARKHRPRFPRGSLLKYFTRDFNEEELTLVAGTTLEVEE